MLNIVPDTLAAAQILIDDYLHHTLRLRPLNQTQQTFLNEIDKRIHTIQEVNHDWLKTGLLSDYLRGVSFIPPTQEALLQEAKEAYKKQLAFTWQATKQLIFDLENEIKHAQDADYRSILATTLACANNVIHHIRPFVTAKTEYRYRHKANAPGVKRIEKVERVELSSDQNNFYSKNNTGIRLIYALGGRYLPFCQVYDPLYGNAKGYCHGHMRDWAAQIKEHNDFAFKNSINKRVYYYQQHQRPLESWSEFFSLLIEAFQNRIVKAGNTFEPLIDEIVESLDPEYIYNLILRFDKTNSAHSVGIRRFKNSETFEFYDSNFGIVVFEDKAAFKYWLSIYLPWKYAGSFAKDGSMELEIVGKQPSTARPIIPPLRTDDFDVLAILEHDNVYKYLCYTSAQAANNKLHENETPDYTLKKLLNGFHLLSLTNHPVDQIEKYHNIFQIRLFNIFDLGPYHLRLDRQATKLEADAYKEKVVASIRAEITRLGGTIIGDRKHKIAALNVLIADIEQAKNTMALSFIIRNWGKKKFVDGEDNDDLLTIIRRPRIEPDDFPSSYEFIQRLIAEHETSIYRITMQQLLFLQYVYKIADQKHDQTLLDIIAKYDNCTCSYQTLINEIKTVANNQNDKRNALYQCIKKVMPANYYQLEACNKELAAIDTPPHKKDSYPIADFLTRNRGKIALSLLFGLAVALTILTAGGVTPIIGLATAIFGAAAANAAVPGVGLALVVISPIASAIITTICAAATEFYHWVTKKSNAAPVTETKKVTEPTSKSHHMIYDILGIKSKSKTVVHEEKQSALQHIGDEENVPATVKLNANLHAETTTFHSHLPCFGRR